MICLFVVFFGVVLYACCWFLFSFMECVNTEIYCTGLNIRRYDYNCDVNGLRNKQVESFRFHPTLLVLFLKQIELYYKF